MIIGANSATLFSLIAKHAQYTYDCGSTTTYDPSIVYDTAVAWGQNYREFKITVPDEYGAETSETIQRNRKRAQHVLIYWLERTQRVKAQIHRMVMTIRRIMRCNRKGIGLRIRTSLI